MGSIPMGGSMTQKEMLIQKILKDWKEDNKWDIKEDGITFEMLESLTNSVYEAGHTNGYNDGYEHGYRNGQIDFAQEF